MQIEDIEIYADGGNKTYEKIGFIKVRVGAATLLSKTPTIEDVNLKLREKASSIGANAIIKVQYKRGISMLSWKALTASGTAVVMESDEIKCPFCAESIKREALKCKYCGERLQQ